MTSLEALCRPLTTLGISAILALQFSSNRSHSVPSKPSVEANVIYTREEAASVLGIGLSTLKQMIRAGHLAVSQPAGIRRIFIRGSSILEMLERTTRTPDATLAFGKQTAATTPSPRPLPLVAGNQPAALWNQDECADTSALRPKRETRRLHPAPRNHTGTKVARARGGVNG